MPEPLVQKALRLIETRIDDDVALAALAAELGVTPYHLCRVFVAAFGQSPMRYLRRRRLSRAVSRLCGHEQPLLDILRARGGDPGRACCARAQSAAFGVASDIAWSGPARMEATLQEPITGTDRPAEAPRPVRLDMRGAFAVAGLAARCTPDTNGAIAAQRAAFVSRIPEIGGRIGAQSYGVCFGTTQEGGFAYMTAAEVDFRARLPTDLVLLRIAPARYAVFEHRGRAATLRDSVVAVWEHGLTGNGLQPAEAPDLEVYPADYDPLDDAGHVELWIPVRA